MATAGWDRASEQHGISVIITDMLWPTAGWDRAAEQHDGRRRLPRHILRAITAVPRHAPPWTGTATVARYGHVYRYL